MINHRLGENCKHLLIFSQLFLLKKKEFDEKTSNIHATLCNFFKWVDIKWFPKDL